MSKGQAWFARPEFLRLVIGAVAAIFIKKSKGPDKKQKDLIKKSKEHK